MCLTQQNSNALDCTRREIISVGPPVRVNWENRFDKFQKSRNFHMELRNHTFTSTHPHPHTHTHIKAFFISMNIMFLLVQRLCYSEILVSSLKVSSH